MVCYYAFCYTLSSTDLTYYPTQARKRERGKGNTDMAQPKCAQVHGEIKLYTTKPPYSLYQECAYFF